jgi:hypothetical protein
MAMTGGTPAADGWRCLRLTRTTTDAAVNRDQHLAAGAVIGDAQLDPWLGRRNTPQDRAGITGTPGFPDARTSLLRLTLAVEPGGALARVAQQVGRPAGLPEIRKSQ